MDGSGFTFVDILVVLILLGSAAYATYRGFVAETLGIFSWVVAIFATMYFGYIAVDLIEPHLSPPWLGAVLGYLAVFVIVLVPLEFLSHRISQTVQHSPVSGLDRGLGFFFGVVRGAVVIGLLYFAYSSFQPVKDQPGWMVKARSFPYIQEASAAVLSLAPTGTGDRIAEKADKMREEAAAQTGKALRKHKKKTYGAEERRALDSLIENTDKPEDGKTMTGLRDETPFDGDTLHEECGVFGIFGHPDAGALSVLGLHALQHRGQEAAGIVTYDGTQFIAERHAGLVGDVFGKGSLHAQKLKGQNALGHVRYSTTGGSVVRNIQPMFADLAGGGIALAHNGNLTNARTLREDLVREGAIFQSTSDTEVIIHLAARSTYTPIVDRLVDALKRVEGAYSLVALTSKKLIGARDPFGVRPLVLGQLDGAPILASETCALDIIGAEFVRDIEPGEVIVITKDGIQSYHPFQKEPHRFCVFEYVYFARPDSVAEGRSVYDARKAIGEELAREAPADADMVIPVPDSGVPAALGFAQAANIPFELGIIRNHYVGRTFIEPSDRIRHLGVRLKHNPNRAKLKGMRVILVDDSIVRGTTSKKIVQMVRDAGASEVHFRIASPPTTHSCFYGVDTPNEEDLLAHRMSVEEMRRFINADSLAFVSMDGLYRATGEKGRNNDAPQFCDACFSGSYPIGLTDITGGRGEKQLSLLAEVA